RARAAFAANFRLPVKTRVHVTPEGGKTRSWNSMVHEVAAPATDLFIFCDADITFARTDAIAEMVQMWETDDVARAVTGYVVKDIARKPFKSLVDRISLGLSDDARMPNALNGSLYVLGADEARRIWLPVPSPGEDGFLSATIKTNGFTGPPIEERVISPSTPTHYYEAHSIAGYFRHEKRITMGTTINGWIFEDLWSRELTQHAGALIRRWNAEDPAWIAKLIQKRIAGRRWVVPHRLLTSRLKYLRKLSVRKAAGRLPLALCATALNIVPTLTANRELKKDQAAGFW
ncbi:MAG TPA: hypothetical protein VEY69_16420, partial [Lautropia sp.]|nr:hypothetical protein [Lautropia sp.]